MKTRSWKSNSLTLVLLLVAVIAGLGASTVKPKIGGSGPIDRPTNHTTAWCYSEWTFCPTALDSFVADGDSATVVFSARNRKNGAPGLAIDFHLDNVVIVERSVYDANLASLAGFNYCGTGATGVMALDFVPLLGSGVVYHTNFNGSIGPEWNYDPAAVTYELTGSSTSESMNEDPFNPAPPTTGSMAIGNLAAAGEYSEAELQLTGLTRGTEYVCSYWSASLNDGIGFDCSEGEVADDWEVSIFGEDLVCVPDIPSVTVTDVRTLGWNPVTRVWNLQLEFGSDGAGEVHNVTASITNASPGVIVLDDDVPIPYLGMDPRDLTAWAGGSYTVDLSNYFAAFMVLNLGYSFTDDCAGASATTGVVILGAPETYPTAAPRLPVAASLGPGSPNPFNPRTILPVTMPRGAEASLMIFDVRGRSVCVLHDGFLTAGEHAFSWHGRDDLGLVVGAGMYLARLRAEGHDVIRRLVLVK